MKPPRRWLQFRTFRGRLNFVFLSLLVVLLAAIFFIVLNANRHNALRQIDAGLETGARIFAALKQQRIDQLGEQARLLAYDYGFKQAFGASANDPATMRLAMQNFRDRIHASFFALVSLEGQVLHDSEQPARDGTTFDLPDLITAAENADTFETSGLALRDGRLFAVVLVPLLAPDPTAWICLGFRIDHQFAAELGSLTGQAVSFLQEEAGGWKVLASTLDVQTQSALKQALPRAPLPLDRTSQLLLDRERFVSRLSPLGILNGRAAVLLQRNLDAELAPFKRLEITLLLVTIAGLALSAAAAFVIARNVTRPVLQLVEDTRRVELGDYTAHDGTDSARADEIGQLALSFQRMTRGLAERDQVRDLLGKVASPAIAAELVRGQATLGGEERTVTILFSDLRDFTAISERLPARAVVEMLNIYFTRMSEIVDAHGGVVDKYIGDALMALFGAPVEQPDHAAHALAAALEMGEALDALNASGFAGEAINFGVGIHTGLVVAGNMGSPQRYNYTVIGDGVNTASRLQSLTRKPEYATRIIVSDDALRAAGPSFATRPLGAANVKGKDIPITIHALTGRETNHASEDEASCEPTPRINAT